MASVWASWCRGAEASPGLLAALIGDASVHLGSRRTRQRLSLLIRSRESRTFGISYSVPGGARWRRPRSGRPGRWRPRGRRENCLRRTGTACPSRRGRTSRSKQCQRAGCGCGLLCQSRDAGKDEPGEGYPRRPRERRWRIRGGGPNTLGRSCLGRGGGLRRPDRRDESW